mmetsp:Transcript_20686/g.23744  ORF Transcript_20686/g.23744 Transcript_20686/m.23744 type:complete len:274 (+) Transcript_20686:1340-2161(+)
MESVGSKRIARIVYSSRRIGSRRGPFTKGEASADDSGTPNRLPCLKYETVPTPNASPILSGVFSRLTPPNTLPTSLLTSPTFPPVSSKNTSFGNSSSSSYMPLYSFNSTPLIGNTASFIVLEAPNVAQASRTAILMASFIESSVPHPSSVHTNPSAMLLPELISSTVLRHQLPTALTALPFCDCSSNKLPVVAPARSREPPESEIAERVSEERRTEDCEALDLEMTNQRATWPNLAVSTAVTSPIPPGGDMITIVFLGEFVLEDACKDDVVRL